MTATYSAATLATVPKDQVRWMIGDTDMSSAMFQDEEITFALTQWTSLYSVVGQCFRSLAAKFARLADHAQGDVRTSHSQKAKAYNELAAWAENMGKALGGGLPYAGGISIADKAAQVANTDRVTGQFSIGMEDDYIPLPEIQDTNQGAAAQNGGITGAF